MTRHPLHDVDPYPDELPPEWRPWHYLAVIVLAALGGILVTLIALIVSGYAR